MKKTTLLNLTGLLTILIFVFNCANSEVLLKELPGAQEENVTEVTGSIDAKTVTPIWTKYLTSRESCNDVYATTSYVYAVSYYIYNGKSQGTLTKYHWNGTLLKQVNFGDLANNVTPYKVTADASGNIFVAGMTDGNFSGNTCRGGMDAFLVKFDADLNQKWVRYVGSSQAGANRNEYVKGVYVNQSGQVFIVGQTNSEYLANQQIAQNGNVYIAKYNTNGGRYWTKLYGGVNNSSRWTSLSASIMDNSGAIHLPIHLYYSANSSHNYMLLRIDSNGQLTAGWTIVNNQTITFRDMTIDSNYNIYLAGHYEDSSSSGGYIMKVNNAYQVVWGRKYIRPNDKYFTFASIANDSAGNIYTVTSEASQPIIIEKSTTAWFKDICKFSANGTLMETHYINSTPNPSSSSEYRESMIKITVNPTNRIYISGRSCSDRLNGLTNPDGKNGTAYLIKYSL